MPEPVSPSLILFVTASRREILRPGRGYEPGKPLSWSSFQSEAENFLKDCKDRMRRVRDHVPYSEIDQMRMQGIGAKNTEGSPMRLFDAYNTLVDAGNRLH
uniref:DUF3829 domain-containing protein n=1 Tax=Pseudomonas graminis TaxID=158627 RepID=A0A7C1WSY9_9PSED